MPAARGGRTLMDPLVSVVAVLEKSNDAEQAAASARKGPEDTKEVRASLGGRDLCRRGRGVDRDGSWSRGLRFRRAAGGYC